MSPKVHTAIMSYGDLQEHVNNHELSLREVRELNDYLSLTRASLSVVG